MTTPPSKWSVAQVADWLASVGLEPEHVNLFTKQEINGEALFEMQTEHFTELGIPMGVRLRVQKHVAAFKDSGAIDANSNDGFAAAAEVKPVPAPPSTAVAPVVVAPPAPVASPPPQAATNNNSSNNSQPVAAASAPAASAPAAAAASSSSSANRGKLGRAYARLRGRAPSIKDIQVSDPREFQHVSGVQFDEGEFVGRGDVPESVKNVLEERGAKIRPGAKPPLPAKNAAAPAVAASATAVAAAAASGAATASAEVPAKPVPAAPKPHAGASSPSGAQFKLAKVLFDYEAQTDEELTVTCGQQVRILEQDESGWWHAATADGATTGFVPGEFVEFISTAATESTQPPSEVAAEAKPEGETTVATETVTATSTSGTTTTTTSATSAETTAKAEGEEEKAKVSVEE